MKYIFLKILASAVAVFTLNAPVSAAPATVSAVPAVPEIFNHGNFPCAPVYRPAGAIRGVVLMLTDSSTTSKVTDACKAKDLVWSAHDDKMARALSREGLMVAGLDLGPLIRDQANGGSCLGFDGDLENFSRVLQARYQLPGYRTPVLIGSGRGATFVYGQLVAANKRTFSGGVSLDFHSKIDLPLPLCKGRGLITIPPAFDDKAPQSPVKTPVKPSTAMMTYALQPQAKLDSFWFVVPDANAAAGRTLKKFAQEMVDASIGPAVEVGSEEEQAEILKAVNQILSHEITTATPPAAVADLPLVEVPLKPPVPGAPVIPSAIAPVNNVLAIMISGDGGWAGIDKDLAKILSRAGVPVIGFDSLRYFWKERTPESTTRDLERVIRYYQSQPQWRRAKVQLIGYSQGADVMPFIVNRLSPDVRNQVASVVLLGLGKRASFEFHVSNWISSSTDGLPIPPEVMKMPPKLGVCIYGADDDESVCPSLTAMRAPVRVVRLPGDHHFDGAYDKLAAQILASVEVANTPAPAAATPVAEPAKDAAKDVKKEKEKEKERSIPANTPAFRR